METLLRNITDLLQLIEATSSDTEPPAAFAERLPACEPSLLLLADAGGKVIAADDFTSGTAPDVVETLAADLAKCLDKSSACTLGVPTDAGPQLAFAVRMPDYFQDHILGCLVPHRQWRRKRLEETPAALVVCSVFAWAAMHNKADNAKLHRRIQHLLAELDTLDASRAEAITAVVEERQQRLRQEEENALLEELIQAAEAANRAKSQFLANASHELRTPLTAILGFADLLVDSKLAEDQRKHYLQIIRQNGQALLELINNILDLSKIEAGKMTVARTDCSPRHIVEDVASLMQVQAAAKGLSLVVDYTFPIPKTIRTDPIRLRQILTNLIGNAIKFTEQGGVRITVCCTDEPGTSPRLRIAVADTGIGMDGGMISQLFKPFTQADPSPTRRFGGTGLGLAISARLAGILGGDIEVKSQLGKGSTFILSIDPGSLLGVPMLQGLPGAATTKKEPAKISRNQTLHGRVLLAEDGEDNQRLIGALLKEAGLEVDLAENGRIACEDASASAAEGKPYDLILMDMQMPAFDGFEATGQLRRDGWQGPIIALMAHPMAGERQKCLQAGCDDCLSKPIERKTLLSAVQRHLTSASSRPGLRTSQSTS